MLQEQSLGIPYECVGLHPLPPVFYVDVARTVEAGLG